MGALLVQAELIKLSRLLGVAERDLGYLAAESVADLRSLRASIGASMYDEDRMLFGKLVAATKLLPTAIVAAIAEKVMGPMICARVAGLLDPDQVVDVAKRLTIPFLADVCLQLDPRSAAPTLKKMPLAVVTAVSAELLRRREYLTMGRFVEVITDEAVRAVAKAMPDVAALHVGYFVESPQRVTELVGLFDDRRIQGIIGAAVSDPEQLWPEALSLMEQVDAASRERLALLGLASDEQVLASLLRTVNGQQLHEPLLAILRTLKPAVLERVGRFPMLSDIQLIGPVFAAALRGKALGYLLPLAGVLTEPTRQELAALLAQQPASTMQATVLHFSEAPFAERLRKDWAQVRPLFPKTWLPALKSAGFQ